MTSRRPVPHFAGLVLPLLLALVAGCGGDDAADPWLEGPLTFRHQIIDPSPPGGADCCTDVCAVGDLDGDGMADIVVGGEHATGPGLVWYAAPLWERRDIASGQFTTDMELADMDGDGRLDIVVGDTDRGLIWLANPGAIDGAWTAHDIGAGYVHDVETGDLDGDGDIDVVTCDKTAVTLWLRGATGDWTSRTLVTRDGEGSALADLDGDGDLDVVLGGLWYETPADPAGDDFVRHDFATWPDDARVACGDVDGDGDIDVALSASEGDGGLAWFAAPADPRAPDWAVHPVGDRTLNGAHTLVLADLDADGRLDLVTAEMHTGGKLVLVYLQADAGWTEMVLGRDGSHNMQVADLEGDGDLDIVGKNYGGVGRRLEAWFNQTADLALVPTAPPAGDWAYRALDDARGDDQFGKMGLVSCDVDADGWPDLAAGSLLYHNPATADADAAWRRTALPDGVDVCVALDVDGDERCDLLAFRGAEALWLEAADAAGETWTATVVAAVPDARTQGHAVAQLVPGGHPELVFTRGMALFRLAIPADPAGAPWELYRISDATEEEGLVVGDLDGDGALDVVTSTADGFHLRCFVNPGPGAADPAGGWPSYPLASSPARLDRLALVDMDGDGRDDLVATEESMDLHFDAGLAWFRRPDDPLREPWARTRLLTLRSANSLGVADFDGDGRPDLAVAEHTDMQPDRVAADNRTLLLLNRGPAQPWAVHMVDVGPRSSHLGMLPVDLDRDGRMDLVSIAWRQFRSLHTWSQRG
ncbi:VCBS repeat-containing protein [bacterium]|nr:VCBS repeat-containing protein [bacterium]